MTDQLTYEEIVERLAPCGIDCQRCVACAHGRVKSLATELRAALQGFERMAPGMSEHAPALAGYDRFAEVLDSFAQAPCPGCRSGGAPLPFCTAPACIKERGVDYCFQCSDYPCEHNAYPEELARRWRLQNDRMREVGVESYYRESLQKPRY